MWIALVVWLWGCGGEPMEGPADDAPSAAETPAAAAGGEAEAPKEQSFAEGMEWLCERYDECRPCLHGEPSEKQAALATWFREKVTNPEAVSVLDQLVELSPDEKAPFLIAAAQRAGLETCSFATPAE